MEWNRLAEEAAYFAAVDAGRESAEEEIAALRAELAAAKEEIERLKEKARDCERRTFRYGAVAKEAEERAAAAESALTSERKETERLRFAVSEVSTHLGAIEAIIKTCIELKPSQCVLTDKDDGICPHCESDISWLQHELRAHGDYSKAIEAALQSRQGEE